MQSVLFIRGLKMSPLKFAANLTFMYQECPNLLDRYKLAQKAGFKAVECAFPYDFPVEDVVTAKERAGVKQVLVNSYVGDVTKGELGFAAIPGKEKTFQESVLLGLKYAKALNCNVIHVMSGAVKEPTALNDETWEKNFRWAAKLFEKEGIVGVTEPINPYSVPNYYQNSYVKAVDLVRKINSPNLKILLDVFHLQQLHGNVTRNIDALASEGLIGHVQIAQVPLRGEPDTPGEINFAHLFSVLEKNKYDGWIGLEYTPVHGTDEGLGWIKAMGYEF